MPRRPRPVPEVVAQLEQWLALARTGQIAELYVLAKPAGGEWDEEFWVVDLDDLSFELRGAAIRVGAQSVRSGDGHAAT
jgi:hypothetical protein